MSICLLQANVHEAFSNGVPAEAPVELHNMPTALSFKADTGKVDALEIAKMLSWLCHLQASARALAADIISLSWLKRGSGKASATLSNTECAVVCG